MLGHFKVVERGQQSTRKLFKMEYAHVPKALVKSSVLIILSEMLPSHVACVINHSEISPGD